MRPVEPIEQRLLSRTVKESSITSINVDTPCWVCSYSPSSGYPSVWVDGKTDRAHRIAYLLWIGDIPVDSYVCHKCDNMRCINPCHLFLGTHQDNVDDMVTKGRHTKGTGHGMSKLTEEDVRYIRMWYVEGFTQEKIAAAFNVAHPTIGCIANRKTWKHIL